MKRRELIKTGFMTLGASTIALSGCSKNDSVSLDNEIIPKQTAQYEFSIPLPFNFKTIDEIVELNSTIKKSQVKRLYNNIPEPLANLFNHWIGVTRGKQGRGNNSIKTFEDFGQYAKYAMDKGFEFAYLMNSPKSFTEKEFLTFKDDFLNLLEYLHKIGVKNIKVGTNQVADLINQYAPNEFMLQVSTCFELHNISQYKNLFEMYPNFNFIDITHDETQNFKLIKSIKEAFPDKKIEILTNEGCIKKCPARITHNQEPHFCKFKCEKMREKIGFAHYLLKSGSIFPWDIEYYSAFGINNFKYTPGHQGRSDFYNLKGIRKLLTIIENGYENYTWQDMYDSDWIMSYAINDKNKDVKLSDIAPLFPSMKHFIKHGSECATRCQAECNYCFECAEKLKKVLYLS